MCFLEVRMSLGFWGRRQLMLLSLTLNWGDARRRSRRKYLVGKLN